MRLRWAFTSSACAGPYRRIRSMKFSILAWRLPRILQQHSCTLSLIPHSIVLLVLAPPLDKARRCHCFLVLPVPGPSGIFCASRNGSHWQGYGQGPKFVECPRVTLVANTPSFQLHF